MHSHGSSKPHDRAYIPAAGADWLLPLYDPLCKLIGAHRYRARLIDAAAIRPGDRVLDIGCGTGALSIAIAERHPGAHVSALDPDPKALARARAKATRAGVTVAWHEGFADALPFESGAFQHVVSSLMLHHLTSEARAAAFREVVRVLAPGGAFHVLDFGPPAGALDRLLLSLFHRDERLEDNLGGRIPSMLAAAGLGGARELRRMRSPFGAMAIWEGRRAG
jgi:ubiquinone/menaquinone biosynthesis C-methylase UbiE